MMKITLPKFLFFFVLVFLAVLPEVPAEVRDTNLYWAPEVATAGG